MALLEPVLQAVDVACLLIACPAEADDDALATVARPLISPAQERGVAVLLPDRAELARSLGADGVHLDYHATAPEDALRRYRYARKIIGEDAIVGVLCPPERHAAMELAEAGADYVGFDCASPEAAALIAWWGEVMTTPCIGFGAFDAAAAQSLAHSGADFVAPDAAAWRSGDPAASFSALAAAIR